MEDFCPDPVSIYSFSNFKLDPPFTLPLIDFALAIDEVLPPQLPNRLDHLVKIIKQSFDVDIQSHQIYDMLLIFKQESKNGKDLLHHNKNIEEELKKYSTNTSNICEYSTSTPFCLPFTILPKSNKCPQCGTHLSSTAKYRIVTLYLANGISTTATVINYSCQARNCSLELGCNVSKEEILIDGSIRACGILVMATNCQVIVAFEEILKSESKKQVTQALTNMYTLAPFLPKLVIYDAGCLLAKFILNNFKDESKPNESINNNNNNTGLNILKTARFFIDRFHLTNHKDVNSNILSCAVINSTTIETYRNH
ncbi:unnamed protein product [Adineta steineri]|uniref:Uncharacterized protein n=1 Tax=Adineta steineri TaxID=433720 RepID=A0A815SZQ8_9BILA|nr:unnamed protein product [Adineta steineri]